MKVDLINDVKPNEWRSSGELPSIPIKRSLPFVTSSMGRMAHRVRSAQLHRPSWQAHHVTFRVWCGTSITSSRRAGYLVTAEPLDGWPVCSTCEGRAIGAGQVPAETIVGHSLTFSPQPGSRPQCDWICTRYDYCGAQTYRCWTGARFTASKDGETRHVCASHRRSAINKGWSVNEDNRPVFPWREPTLPPAAPPVEVPVLPKVTVTWRGDQ